jgi:hypothetical protein
VSEAEGLDEQRPGYLPRRHNPCRCDSLHGSYRAGCTCRDDDGVDVTHGGTDVENSEHDSIGYPRRTS